MGLPEYKEQLNRWGQERVPFLFMIDFEMEKPVAWRLNEINDSEVLFNVNGFSNAKAEDNNAVISIQAHPIPYSDYKIKFDKVFQHLAYGDSYLTNLTLATPIDLKGTLLDIYRKSAAPYKFLYKDEFLVFSPEGFIKIQNGKISSYPMKGTIDAAIPNAKELILSNQKEMAEHVTIVDLIRNDLSTIASNVHVNRFRYIDEIKTNHKKLLQVSSEIVGDLDENWEARMGDILMSLLPAGSISGAPKAKTLSIISQSEMEKRGYYSGVFGYFDGQQVDSGVMIRYIENRNGHYNYRSGGGITAQSIAEQEYQETIDKVYVPIT